jgi:hypothetical protein
VVESLLHEFVLSVGRNISTAVTVDHPGHGHNYGAGDRRSAANFACVSR